MGNQTAQSLRNSVDEGTCDIDTALRIHFNFNHYPPLPLSLLPVAKKAIQLAGNEQYDELIDLPEGITWKRRNKASVYACVNAWHLDCFLKY